jgi:hypothetical protein
MALPLPWAWNIDRTTCSRYRACQITGGRKLPPASLALHALIAREIYSVPGDPVAPCETSPLQVCLRSAPPGELHAIAWSIIQNRVQN